MGIRRVRGRVRVKVRVSMLDGAGSERVSLEGGMMMRCNAM